VSNLGAIGAQKSLNAIESAVGSLTSSVQNLGSRALSPVSQAFTGFFRDLTTNGINALLHVKSSIESFSFIKLNMQMQSTTSAFTTLTGSVETANQLLKDLRVLANATPFEFTQLTAATKKMLAFGFSVDEITKKYGDMNMGLLEIVGNASNALGAGAEGVDRITRALGQMRALERVSAEDMNQLTDVGISGYRFLAEGLGKTVAEVREMMKKGQLDAETGIRLMLEGMQRQYGGGMEAMSKTAEGMSSTLNDVMADMQRAFGQVAYQEYASLLNDVTKLVGSPAFAKFAQMLGVEFGGAVKNLNDNVLKPAIARMTEFINVTAGSDEKMSGLMNSLMTYIRPVTETLKAVNNIFMATARVAMQFISAFLRLKDVGSTVKVLTTDFNYFLEGLFNFADKITVSDATMQKFAQTVFNVIKPIIDIFRNAVPVVTTLASALGVFIKQMIDSGAAGRILDILIAGLYKFADALKAVVPYIANTRDAIPEMFSMVAQYIPRITGWIKDATNTFATFGLAARVFYDNITHLFGGNTHAILEKFVGVWNKLVQVFYNILPAIANIGSMLPYLFGAIAKTVPPALRELKSMVDYIIEKGTAFYNAMSAVVAGIRNVADVILSAFKTGDFSVIETWASALMTKLSEVVSTYINPDSIAAAITLIDPLTPNPKIVNWLLSTLGRAVEYTASNLHTIVTKIVDGFSNTWDEITTNWNADSSGIKAALNKAWDALVDEWNNYGKPMIMNAIGTLPDAIATVWKNNAPTVGNALNEAWKIVGNGLDTMWNGMVNFFTPQKIDEIATKLRESVRDGMQMLWKYTSTPEFYDGANRLMRAVGGILEGAFRGLITFFSGSELKEAFDLFSMFVAKTVDVLAQTAVIGVAHAIKGTIDSLMNSTGLQSWMPNFDSAMDNWIAEQERKATENAQFFDDQARKISERYAEERKKMGAANTATDSAQQFAEAVSSVPSTSYVDRYSQAFGSTASAIDAATQSVNTWSASSSVAFDSASTSATNAAQKMTDFKNNSADFSRGMETIYNQMGNLGNTASINFVNNFSNYILGDGKKSMVVSFTQAMDSLVAILNDGRVFNKFFVIGQTIAGGVIAGINANLTGILAIITDKLGLNSLASGLSTVTSAVTTLQSQVAAIEKQLNSPAGLSSTANGIQDTSTTVNQKNVNLQVTINQTTPTDTVNNIRYAQALATSKIY
jgi:tape measure domain-containing protein